MAKPNIFDRAVIAVAPVHAAKRAAARAALSVINSGYGNYGANLTKKSMRGWEFYGGSPKEDIEDNINVLRQRSRDAYMGIPTAAAALKTMRTNVIAGGLMPAPQIDGEYLGLSEGEMERLQAQIVREFSLWADTPVCDAERIDNFYQLQQLAFLGYLMNGDEIALLPMKRQVGQPYDLRVQLVEADRVCSPDGFDRLMPCTVQGYKVHSIVQGVETDADGMVVAYWVCNHHPLGSHSATDADGITWKRVEAYGAKTGRRNVLHVMNRERAGQRRGVPILAPVLESLKQLGRYTDAEITAAVISAMFTVFVKSQNPTEGRPFGEMIPAEELIDRGDENSIELGPGAIIDLNPGEDVQFADPKHPNTGYDAFTSATIRMIGAALEIPPEVMLKQFSISATEIVTSESGYGSKTPFWTKRRKKGTGNWGAGSGYTFLGFIYNPAVSGSTTTTPAPNPPTTGGATEALKYKVGQMVQSLAKKHYTSSNAATGKNCKPCEAKVTAINPGSKHPYHVVGTSVYGWVDEDDIAATASADAALAVGDRVKMDKSATIYGTMRKFAAWVYAAKLYVRGIDGNRVVVSTLKSGAITGAVDKKHLTKV